MNLSLCLRLSCRKSVFSLNELGQMNGTAGGKGALDQDEEMPEQHELGEELAFTGRYGKNCPELWLNLIRLKHTERDFGKRVWQIHLPKKLQMLSDELRTQRLIWTN